MIFAGQKTLKKKERFIQVKTKTKIPIKLLELQRKNKRVFLDQIYSWGQSKHFFFNFQKKSLVCYIYSAYERKEMVISENRKK